MRIADYAGDDNVKKFREIVDKYRKAWLCDFEVRIISTFSRTSS